MRGIASVVQGRSRRHNPLHDTSVVARLRTADPSFLAGFGSPVLKCSEAAHPPTQEQSVHAEANPCGVCGGPTQLVAAIRLPAAWGSWACDECGTERFKWHDQVYGCATFSTCDWAKCAACWAQGDGRKEGKGVDKACSAGSRASSCASADEPQTNAQESCEHNRTENAEEDMTDTMVSGGAMSWEWGQ